MQAIHQSQGVCVLPFGILEKHGPHLPIGTDLLDVRYAVMNAVQQEYAVVFPEYYFGQIFEAQQEPGTIAYSLATQLTLLQETVKEMARNGCKKIVIVNGHGGNNSLLPLFAQAQLATPRDYVVYVFGLPTRKCARPPGHEERPENDMHAGETETSAMLVARPDLVHMDRAQSESGADQHRLNLPDSCTPASGGTRASRITTRARLGSDEGTGRVRSEDVVEPDRRGHQSHQGRFRKPAAAERVLREDAASAGYEAVTCARQ